ncbi:MAG: hypothetical protein HZB91_03700 [Elusimicrobia bacterium]|nr:hypothetical protein [Elusimicrobiota bacterium]
MKSVRSVVFAGAFLACMPAFAGNSVEDISRRCRPADPGEARIYSSDFSWNMTLPGMKAKFDEMYRSPKRLGQRAYWDKETGTLRLPYMKERGGTVELPAGFVAAVARHIEVAFEKDLIDAVFFPDMGHSHFLIPDAVYKEKYEPYPTKKMGEMYTAMMRDPRIEVFYHTAEQLKTREKDGSLVDDERTRHRYRTRNISGLNEPWADLRILQNPESNANTVGVVPGFFWWGAGFNMSAQKDGCFEYRRAGKAYRFDLSLFDLEPDPNKPGSEF